MEGVEGFYNHESVPGHNDTGAVIHDEEVFASKVVTCIGQAIGVIVAATEAQARAAARAVVVKYEDLPAVLSIEAAIAAGSFYQVLMLSLPAFVISCCQIVLLARLASYAIVARLLPRLHMAMSGTA